MKILCSLIALLMMAGLLISTSHAQVTFALGPRFGMNFGSCSLDPEITAAGVTKGGRTGMIFGADFEVGFAHMFYVSLQPAYVQKGFTISGQGGKETYGFNYLNLPLYFRVKFLHGKIRPYSFLGPNLGILLSATKTTELTGQTATDADWKDVIGSDFSLDFGGGAEYYVAPKISITGDVRYMLGLKSVYSNANQTNVSIKTGGFVIMFGAMFLLN
jgi:hypothetical protein